MKVVKSRAIHKHNPTRTAAKAQPTMVMFFQSELRREEQVTWVPESTGTKVTSTVFLAVVGDIPQSDPCLTTRCFGRVFRNYFAAFLNKGSFQVCICFIDF